MVGILIAAAVALTLGLVGTPLAIRTFRRRGLGQLIQADLPDAHQTKRGTPTMGGTVIILGAVVGYLVVHLFSGGRVPFTAAGSLVVALVMFGPGRLPEIGGALGRGIKDFRKALENKGGDDDATAIQKTDNTPKA